MIAYIFPGQGSQQVGMGGELFDAFPEITASADAILGYSIKTLCLEDPERKLTQTRFTQPALYTVNVLAYLNKVRQTGSAPDFVAGHSLGEYAALYAAGVFDFETGLRLVRKRGELMGLASGGGMAAVVGPSAETVQQVLRNNGADSIDMANFNTPSQTVIAGLREEIERAARLFESPEIMYLPLNVSGAFQSRQMEPAAREFAGFLGAFELLDPVLPVIANVSARPYGQGEGKQLLTQQITRPVRWCETVSYLLARGVIKFEEMGPGNVLTRLVQSVRREAQPLTLSQEESAVAATQEARAVPRPFAPGAAATGASVALASALADPVGISASALGCSRFKKEYKLAYAYLAGSMFRGISSKEMVVRLGRAGMLGFLGSGGLGPQELEAAIRYIQSALPNGEPYGVNLLHNMNNPEREEEKVALFLRHGVSVVEASAYLSITPALLLYRAFGLHRNARGEVTGPGRIIAKVSRPEVAEAFLAPAPERLLEKMLREGKLREAEAVLLREVPVATDLCVEADSGGHTDAGVAYALLPTMLRLRDAMTARHGYLKKIPVGAAGGIGTPQAAAAAFVLGADFILTGSINQCTVEAGTADAVKDLLQQMNVQDTDYAPAGDMFELGARVQVLKKGLFFPARANKLFELYRHHNSLEEIDPKTRVHLEERFFRCTLESAYAQAKEKAQPEEVAKAERNPKSKMALVFKSYFDRATQLALTGQEESRVDYQIHCGPALGAFNQWVKGTALEDWRNRHADEIGLRIMTEAAQFLNRRFRELAGEEV